MPKSRWCTRALKLDVINKHLLKIKQEYNLIQYIGIAFDEQNRAKLDDPNFRYPLIDWEWTEKDALNYCFEKGYDFGNLYTYFDRVSCWCCPLQPLKSARSLRKNFPDLWKQLIQMQEKVPRIDFKDNWSVQNLDIRFAFEEERLKNGLSITNREFFRQLKGVLNSSVNRQIES